MDEHLSDGRLKTPKALAIACAATAAALLLQGAARSTWQIRSLPERVMEWLLLFVPLDLFERGLAQFGTDAKEVALYATMLCMAAVLVVVGMLLARSSWPSIGLLGTGVGLWLFAMVVVMPVTGAGFFATDLLITPLLTNAAYLLVFLGYATVLVAGRLAIGWATPPGPVMAERRTLIAGVLGTLLAGGLAAIVGREGGLASSTLPLAAAPTPVPTRQPTAPPLAAAAQQPTLTSDAQSQPTSQPTPIAAPTLEPLPNPPPPRRLARNQDGSLTAAGRPPGELAPPLTSNDNFYIVTKNAVEDPIVDAASWRLIVDGEVNSPKQLDYRTLRALPVVEVTKTLECISNFTSACNLTSFGCDLISTARWRGARLSDVLDLAGGLKSTAVGLAFFSTDEFSAGLPIEVVDYPDTLIVYEMNDQPLPREHGFPARLLVPGRYGMKNPKWLAGIRAMTQEYAGWYEQRNWNKDGFVKTMSRIDTPADGAMLSPGQQRLAGIAYAGARGISGVEFSLDGGVSWQPTQLLPDPAPENDTMVRWQASFMLAAGQKIDLTVRATDGTGDVQPDDFQLPQPDGASGRDMISVSAA